MTQFQPTRFQMMPAVVKNLLGFNVLFFMATLGLGEAGIIDLQRELAMYYFDAPSFKPYQLVTHMFMHGGFMHIIFNMFALWMFGSVLESVWGAKRFLIFYLVSGLGALILHQVMQATEMYQAIGAITTDQIYIQDGYFKTNGPMDGFEKVVDVFRIPVLGASGAVYGLLVGFAMLFPNTKLMLLFLPVPIAAKYFVPVLVAIDLFGGFSSIPGDNIAHFAHLGGALFGFIMVLIFQRSKKQFY